MGLIFWFTNFLPKVNNCSYTQKLTYVFKKLQKLFVSDKFFLSRHKLAFWNFEKSFENYLHFLRFNNILKGNKLVNPKFSEVSINML